MYLNEYQMIMI